MSAQPDDVAAEPFWAHDPIRWPRTLGEIEAECAKLNEKAVPLLDLEQGSLDAIGQGIIGIWTAAAWTTGQAAASPMTRQPATVDAAHLVEEIKLSGALSGDRSLPTWAYARGVRCWLAWIMGIADRVLYPDEA